MNTIPLNAVTMVMLLFSSEDASPIVFHVDDEPLMPLRFIERFVELTDG